MNRADDRKPTRGEFPHSFPHLNAGAVILFVFLLALAGVVACGGGGEQGTRAASCTSLAELSLPDTTITSATVIPAVEVESVDNYGNVRTDAVPEYCKVLGTLEGTTSFEVALPTMAWNGRFFYAGGGGFNGTIPSLLQGLSYGFAAAGSDTGHQGPGASFALNDPQAQINYGHRATHLVTVLAKEIVRVYYGQEEQFSYWMGCSNGGKMGLMEVQRYPEDFEGVLVGNMVIDRTRLMMFYTWIAQALAAAPIPPSKLPMIARATLAACDGQDGLVDGVIDSPDRCQFDPKTLTCSAGDGDDCLTPGQVRALEKTYAGPVNSAGQRLYPGYPPGHEEDYARFLTGSGTKDSNPPSTWNNQNQFMKYFVFGPSYDPVKDFNFDTDLAALEPFAKDQDAANPDLSAFKALGGKLIMYHGWADHSIPALRTVQYYRDIREKHGNETDEFVRLFMVPGLHHCTRGPGPNNFGGRGHVVLRDDAEHNIMRALMRWVEEGVAPERITAAKFVDDDTSREVARTRPLCPYPQVARWTGSGSIDEAANFVCADPGG